MSDERKLMRALEKRAYGYTAEERSSEYDAEGHEIRTRVTVKDVPPDMTAIKLLLEMRGDAREPTEEELERERDRLLALLAKKIVKEDKQ